MEKTFTLYDACKAMNVGYDYPEDPKANSLIEETNLKIVSVGFQHLQENSQFKEWASLGLSETSLQMVTEFMETKEPVFIGKTMR